MKISVIIPNYNGEELLKRNIPKVIVALLEYSGPKEIIIADDASTDNSIEVIKKIIQENKNVDIKLVDSIVNRGFSSNVNAGVNVSVGDIIILLNTDVAPKKNFLKPLLAHFSDEKTFAVGSLDESIEGSRTVLRGRGIGQFKRGFLVHKAGELDKDNTLWVSGGSSAFRKSIWDKLGGLDENFDPFYWEDIDLSFRALKSGYKIYFEKESVVVHEHEKGSIKNEFSSKKIKKIAYRNQIMFIWKNTNFGTLISNIFWLPYHLIKTLVNGDSSFVKGFILAVIKLPRIIGGRRKAQKLFSLSDSQVTQSIQ